MEDPRLVEALEEYLAALESGGPPDRGAFLARHADVAGALAACLAGLDALNGRPSAAAARAAERPAAREAPGTELGDFRIVREVGHGGMGVVYEAEQISLGRRVALKVLPFAATMDPRQLQRFHNEARAAACLHHPHVVPVYFVGCERGVHFYAMQLIAGRSLAEAIGELRRRGPGGEAAEATVPFGPAEPPAAPAAETRGRASSTLPAGRGQGYYRRVAELGVQAAEALDYAHQMGIVHRDVKPGNLLVDGRGDLWVTDFGLAQVQRGEGGLTVTGDVVGTLRYMSPEQALGKRAPLDHRADVYSLGATLYEMLTLEPIFAGRDRQALLRQVAQEEPVPPRRLDRGVPADLETIVLKAVEKEPRDRYATAQELADDLRRWLEDRPVRARRPTLAHRLGKWARRHRPAVAAAAAVVVVAAVLGGGTALWWLQKRAEAQGEARAALREAAELQQEGKWSEALSAVRRGHGILAGVGADPGLRRQIEEVGKDLEMALRLQEARLRMAGLKDGAFDGGAAREAYADAFRWYGIDVEGLEPAEAAGRIRSRSIGRQLAAALDDWAYLRRKEEAGGRKHLLAVARAADPHPWRDRLRDALERQRAGQGNSLLASGKREGVQWQLKAGAVDPALEKLIDSAQGEDLDPATAAQLASLTRGTAMAQRTLALLRQVQQRHPGDFWVNHELGLSLMQARPARMDEAIRYWTVAVALRPRSPGARVNLGVAFFVRGRPDDAAAELRQALLLDKDYPDAHLNLGNALANKGLFEEAIAEFREAIRLKPNDAEAHCNLGNALKGKGSTREGIAEYRTAIRLQKDLAEPHHQLGMALLAGGGSEEGIAELREAVRLDAGDARLRLDLGNALLNRGQEGGAIAEYRAAVRLDRGFASAHYNLGVVLYGKGLRKEAIAEYRTAIRLKNDYPEAHCNLGIALVDEGQLTEGIAEYREALRFNKGLIEAHVNLGVALSARGQLDEAIAEYRETLRLKKDHAQARANLALVQRVQAAAAKLPAILKGEARPADAGECLLLARFCQQPFKGFYAASARFYGEAFARQPNLADDLKAAHRYNAACAAALAGCRVGDEARALSDGESAGLRKKALAWLRSDLTAWGRLLKSTPGAAPAVRRTLEGWLADHDFDGVRGDEPLGRWPEAERRDWQQLWREVEEVRRRAGSPPPEGSPRP